MIDRLDSAIRRGERIRSAENEPGLKRQAEASADWVDRDVCPVVQELLARSDFRKWARWPIDRLERGDSGLERELIEAADAALVHAATALAAFGGLAVVRSALIQIEAAANSRTSAICTSGSGPAETLSEIRQPVSEAPSAHEAATAMPAALAAVSFIASRPWVDLVAIGDYFAPVNDLNLRDRDAFLGPNTRDVQIAEFLPFCNPRLRPLGDFVSRTLLVRVEFWQNMLQKFWVSCQRIARKNQLEDGPEWSRASAAMSSLSERANALRHALMDDRQLRLREACLALVQIYASFRPQADLSFLGSLAKLAGNAGAFRYMVERRQVMAIPEQVEAALTEVIGLYRSQEDQEDRISELSTRHPLLLVEGPGRREAYWNGELVDADWEKHERPWALLVALVEQRSLGLGADGCDANCSAKDARHRLKGLIPTDLNEKIVPAGQGTYKLELSMEEVCLLQCRDQDERFVAFAPARGSR